MILSKNLSLTKFDLKLLNVAGKGRKEGRKGHCWKGSNVIQPNDNIIVSQVHFIIKMINVKYSFRNLCTTLMYSIKRHNNSKNSVMLG